MLTINTPGLIGGLAEADYHADPCPAPSASAHGLLTLYQRSPLHAWYQHPKLNPNCEPDRGATAEQIFGQAVHSLLFGGRPIERIDAADWRKKEAQQARADAIAAGSIPLLTEAADRAAQMAAAAIQQLETHELTKAMGSAPFKGGHPEMTALWQREGLWLRGRMDYWNPVHNCIYDYKTTSGSAHPEVWARRLIEDGGAFQAILYPEGVQQALVLDAPPTFRVIVQETEAPFCLCVVELAESARDLASQQVEMAWHSWAKCLRENQWPGYPQQIAAIQAPNWAFYQHQARAQAAGVKAAAESPYLLQ